MDAFGAYIYWEKYIKLAGKILDKNIYVYDSEIQTTLEEVIHDIKLFDILLLLRKFADLAALIFANGNRKTFHFDMPLTDDFLMLSAQLVVENGVHNNIKISENDLHLLMRKIRYLYDKNIMEGIKNQNELLLKIAYKGFVFQEKLLNSIARTILIYSKIWDSVNRIKINEIFEDTLDLSLDELFLHTFIIIGSKESFYFGVDTAVFDEVNKVLGTNLSMKSESAYLRWISRNISELKDYTGSLDNPLTKYPIIDTNIIPEGQNKKVYIITSKNNVYFKMTYYLYYDFIEKYSRGSGENSFKEMYGYAFQEYVGILLNNYFKKWHVYPEMKYKVGKDQVATVDWFIEKDGKIVMFEIKQSSIFLNTKQTGSLESYKEDCSKTIMKAIKQLKTTEINIKCRKFTELKCFSDAHTFIKVCIIADPLYWGNLLIPQVVAENSDTHIINITEFEDLLSLQKRKEGLFYLLLQKESNKDYVLMDFKEYIIRKYKRKCKKVRINILDEEYKEYMNKIGIGRFT